MMAVEPDAPPVTFVTATLRLFEVEDPGSGLVTLMATVPTWATVAVPVAVSCVEETKVVLKGVPAKFTWAPVTKFPPSTVRVKEPTTIVLGEIEMTNGVGLFTVKFTEAEMPPPGFGLLTVTA
jgi:hypothetical protein